MADNTTNLDYHRARYILMAHSPEGYNDAYLYPHTKRIEVVGDPADKRSVDILQTVGWDWGEENAEYLANYQLNRLASGLIAASHTVFRTYYKALDEARRIVLQEVGHLPEPIDNSASLVDLPGNILVDKTTEA